MFSLLMGTPDKKKKEYYPNYPWRKVAALFQIPVKGES